MSDNTTLPPGGGGDTIRTMDRATSKTQVVGLDIGPDAGPESLISATNPLPVSQLIGSVWTVAASGTFTVAGTVAVSNFPSTQQVAGTVAVSNFPTSQPVTFTDPGPDAPVAVYVVGNPDKDFAGVSPLELALDPATGVTLQTVATLVGTPTVVVSNPTPTTVFPAVQAVSLPPNVAQEQGGQLALILEMLGRILVELKLMNYQELQAFGLVDEQETFRADPTLVN